MPEYFRPYSRTGTVTIRELHNYGGFRLFESGAAESEQGKIDIEKLKRMRLCAAHPLGYPER